MYLLLFVTAKWNRRGKMKTIMAGIVFFSAISSANAMMVADGVELVASNSWVTGNAISGHMEENRVLFSHASAYASAIGGWGKIFTNIMSTGIHSFWIDNTSDNAQTYTVYVMCKWK